MDRRALLSSVTGAVGSGLAGCLSTLEPSRPSPTGYQVSTEESIDDPPVKFEADMVGGGFSDPSQPLTIELQLVNTLDVPVNYGDVRFARFHGQKSLEPKDRYALYIEEYVGEHAEDMYEYTGSCWRQLPAPLAGAATYFRDSIEAGATLRTPLILLRWGESLTERIDVASPPTCPDEPPEQITFRTWSAEPIRVYFNDQSVNYECTLTLSKT